MDSRVPRHVTKAATGAALVAGLVVALTAGTAQAGPQPAGGNLGVRSDRVILKSTKVGAAATATLSLSATAPRVANGAAAKVKAQYRCPRGYDGYLEIQLVEATHGHVSQTDGFNSKALTCNGATQQITITVVVSNDYALTAGKAFGHAILDASSDTDEATAATERTITVT
ncbi:hypothetical protein [Microlunatus ginsengisoli]|uniref:Neocarzinostatin family protein n=1 Tax=Microlunatus ginsengisoli TaxID=363863 RepID=A0ABP7AZW5_9ACTN